MFSNDEGSRQKLQILWTYVKLEVWTTMICFPLASFFFYFMCFSLYFCNLMSLDVVYFVML